MVNQLDSKDAKTIKNHMLVENITEFPSRIMGAPSCIDFMDNKHIKRLVMCLPSPALVDGITQAYLDFMQCRIGDNLKGMTDVEIKRVINASCMGQTLDVSEETNEKKLMSFLKPFLPQTKEISPDKLKGLNPAYGLRVPGTPSITEKSKHY